MAKMTCVIAEDDALSAAALKKCIDRNGDLEIIAQYSSGEETLEFLNNNPCDILFLDVELGGMNGLELIRKLQQVPYVIIVSGLTKYAAEAFNFDVIDYIVKPVTFNRLEHAIHKVKKVADSLQVNDSDFFYLKQDSKMIQLKYKDLIYVEALADYVNLYTPTSRFTILSTMKAVENHLPKKDFMRVHRSYIVRMDKIKEIEDYTIVLENKLIPVSRSNRELFMNRLNLL